MKKKVKIRNAQRIFKEMESGGEGEWGRMVSSLLNSHTVLKFTYFSEFHILW